MILDDIVMKKIAFLEKQKKRIPLKRLEKIALSGLKEIDKNNFILNLKKDGISIIGEFKNASPSAGDFDSKIDLRSRIAEYNESVDAISCLTEVDYFKGSIEYFEQIKKLTQLPILRKDFVIDEYQIFESKAIGASALLLICAILDDNQLSYFYDLARSLQLDVLVEVHDEKEMERALKLDARIIGVNNRNLNDFKIDLDTTKRLRKLVGDDKVFISESGIYSLYDIEYLADTQIDAFLVGQFLMEAWQPSLVAKNIKNTYKKGRDVVYEN
ncbi:indole-3-glycerol phosphate synthase TrpC [Lachnobacterium bovis]|uniref:Indole-3-glycerol phosphate synthase n=1 Tax=Lachnobacterium bovis TaxID=140626 RepID=A0A1H9TW35_9FIRM|nr:indole-3-glycerol phosphate synthase TrpC [Lachnobacterium bovis]SES01445.1 indole-3-glycerol phosphate synthase [Lachnobacterium bovis]